MKLTRLLLVLVSLPLLTLSAENRKPSQVEQAKRQLAATELAPLAAQAYERHRLAQSLTVPSVTFTVATKRYDNSFALVALNIHSDDSAFQGKLSTVTVKFQPIKLLDGERTEAVGASTKGVFKHAGSLTPDLICDFTQDVLMPAEAQAIRIGIVVESEAGKQGLTINMGTNDEARTCLGTVGSLPVSQEITLRQGRPNMPGIGKSLLPVSSQEYCCHIVNVDCGNCHKQLVCNMCQGSPTITCTGCVTGTCICNISCVVC